MKYIIDEYGEAIVSAIIGMLMIGICISSFIYITINR